MAIIPVDVDQASIISLVLNDLLLGDLEALSVLELALTHGENLTCLLGADGRLAEAVNRNWWPHVLEHMIISAWHFYSN